MTKGEQKMKKNKDTEVQIEEITINKNGEVLSGYEMKIGKKVIGKIEVLSEKKYNSMIEDENLGVTKSLDEAMETIIRHWNLFQ